MTVVKFDLGENRSLDGGSGALGSAIVRGAKRESKDECWGGVRNRREAEEGGGGDPGLCSLARRSVSYCLWDRRR